MTAALLRASPPLAELERTFKRDGTKWTIHGPVNLAGAIAAMFVGGVMFGTRMAMGSTEAMVDLPLLIVGIVLIMMGIAGLIFNIMRARTFTFDDGTSTLTIAPRWAYAAPEEVPYLNISHIQVDDKSYTRVTKSSSGFTRASYVRRMQYSLSFTDRSNVCIAYGKGEGEDWAEFLAARKSTCHYCVPLAR